VEVKRSMAAWARIGSAKVGSHSPGPRLEVMIIEPARWRSKIISWASRLS
jgi:hypothetical protein